MYCEQRIYNNVHICVLNKEYTTMYIYVLRTENIQQCTYMYVNRSNIQQCTYMSSKQRIYKCTYTNCEQRHIQQCTYMCGEQRIYNQCICENREYTTMYIYVLWTENIQQCTYMCFEQGIYNNEQYELWTERI